MKLSRLAIALAAASLATVTAVTSAVAASPSAGTATGIASTPAVTPLPTQVYAPYFETYLPGNIDTVSAESGVKYFTLAFLQARKKQPCTLYWNGDFKDPVSGGEYLSQIATLRSDGGDVIPSFGGYSADHGGTELADACTDVSSIVADYEQVVTLYGVSRLDFDIESRSLVNTAGIDRRNEAIARLEAWASKRDIPLQVSFTMPSTADALTSTGIKVLANAVADGARVDVVNIMTFDYYNGTTAMGKAAISAGRALHDQLAKLYPSKSSDELWAMEAITLMPGIDDNPDLAEVTSLANTRNITRFAEANHLSTLSIWAIQRDNGGCPGTNGSNTCSGVKQPTWGFSHILRHFDT